MNLPKSDKKLGLVAGFIFVLFGAMFLVFNFPDFERNVSAGDILEVDQCPIKTEERIVRGNSLSSLVRNGDTVKVLFGYYDCYDIKRGDIVLYSYAGNKDPLIKIVKGISGDKFNLQKTNGGWNIIVNNQIVKNSESKPYLISGNAYEMLSLYERDYKGTIPLNAYLLLGNQSDGSIDSTRFGLVDKPDILGKVEY
jgi:signal peptidase I